ncbi:MAG: VOC family protein [Acidimicrobiales bacterium]
MTPTVLGLNHAVLWVGDPPASAHFYADVLGLEITSSSELAAFLRSPLTGNDHDLAVMRAEHTRPAPARQVGLYHLAWEVPTLADMVGMRDRLVARDALVGQSDHQVSKSLYAHDPDGNEFEVMWQVPTDLPADPAAEPETRRLDIEAEIERYGADTLTRTLRLLGSDRRS